MHCNACALYYYCITFAISLDVSVIGIDLDDELIDDLPTSLAHSGESWSFLLKNVLGRCLPLGCEHQQKLARHWTSLNIPSWSQDVIMGKFFALPAAALSSQLLRRTGATDSKMRKAFCTSFMITDITQAALSPKIAN